MLTVPLVQRILGGEDKPRFAEFNFREAPEGAGQRAMNVHHDRTSPGRLTREPYGEPDWLCAIHYLTDVNENTPREGACTPTACHRPSSSATARRSEAQRGRSCPYRG